LFNKIKKKKTTWRTTKHYLCGWSSMTACWPLALC